ncbi:calmodulin, partial [Diplocarpon rosae]
SAKRRAAESADGPVAKQRPSKLAKEHNITAAEELEIKEAFEIFQESRKGEKEKVIPIGDVRRAMKALGIAPEPDELEEFISILDPDEEGFAVYSSFVAICALKFHNRTRTSDSHAKEVDEAFQLFTGSGGEGKITIATLRRVAQLLREDVDEELMRRMILEANGGAGVAKGVEKDEFESIMRKAGVWR